MLLISILNTLQIPKKKYVNNNNILLLLLRDDNICAKTKISVSDHDIPFLKIYNLMNS
jgi:hypothetical protein